MSRFERSRWGDFRHADSLQVMLAKDGVFWAFADEGQGADRYRVEASRPEAASAEAGRAFRIVSDEQVLDGPIKRIARSGP